MNETETMYIMMAAAAMLIVFIVFFMMKGKGRGTAAPVEDDATKSEPAPEPAFENKKYLLLPGERSFLNVLEKAVPEGYRVFGNVPLADLVRPTKRLVDEKGQTALKQVEEMRVAFAVCSAEDLALVGVVELDGRLQGDDAARQRDLLEQALVDAHIPLVTFSSEEAFELRDLQKRLVDSLKLVQSCGECPDGPASEPAPSCPRCASPMVKRLAMRGPHIGKFFWTCSAYPHCRHVEPVQVNPAYAALADTADESVQPSV